jgi:hypothetical protein
VRASAPCLQRVSDLEPFLFRSGLPLDIPPAFDLGKFEFVGLLLAHVDHFPATFTLRTTRSLLFAIALIFAKKTGKERANCPPYIRTSV